ncbi:putative mynd finger family protein [Phaeoacremonium minimum UCRPA7]|uniref:Putative mynd finger family protein n=1 Tax=Phaeoacremonium minimum (strain UCR-PA7) TaxID=1286976 RepID=R8BDE2_PHAM7|nr:putative mynd finger family protein [Phaeoacremonium minimum UCRPA7]EON97315.1 putative mynd finger family protein [Phaeoacremonium minimum UCRPA7]
MQSYEETDNIPDFNLEFAALSKLWGVYQPLFPELREDRKLRGFNDWDQIPDIVVVNIQVSGDLFKNIFDGTASFPTLSISVASYYEDASSKQDTFASLSYNFGKIELQPDGSFSIVNGNDRITPASDGRFDMIISFYAPSHILHFDPRPTLFTIQTYDKVEGRLDSTVIGDIGDIDKILVTHMLPGLSEEPNSSIHPQVGAATSIAHPETCVGTDPGENDEVDTNFTLAPLSPSVVKPLDLPYSVDYSLKVDEQLEKVVGMVAHVSIKSQEGKDLLLIDRCVVTLRQESPFMVRVLFANSTYTPMCVFPLPIILDKASKPRVARQSSWVEFIVLVADPVTAASSADIVFPNQISAAGDIVSLNLPYINMDILPILDLTDKERIGFLTTLASMQFSAKERVLREEAHASTDTGIMPSARANFKETVMTMFMLASGVQGGQSGLMALNVEGGQGIHMLFFVSAVRLDGPTSSVILDAAVIPVTSAMLLDSTFGEFLMVLRHFEIATLIVNEDELRLWKQVLPAMVERCRAWPHSNDCVYRKVHQAPVSTDHGQLVLCDCGKGKLPPGFVTAGLPGWDEVGVHHATRVAISPTFAVPLTEDLVSTENLIKMQASRLSTTQDHCVNCGATESIGGGRLKKCTRCHRVQYCSTVCQKKDWSKHRPECLEYKAAGS